MPCRLKSPESEPCGAAAPTPAAGFRPPCCFSTPNGRYFLWMTRPVRHPEPGGLGALVVLALGFQIMLAGAALAGAACADPFERTGVRRLVAQAIREISDRAIAQPRTLRPEPTWAPAPRSALLARTPGLTVRPALSAWVLSVAPPRVA